MTSPLLGLLPQGVVFAAAEAVAEEQDVAIFLLPVCARNQKKKIRPQTTR